MRVFLKIIPSLAKEKNLFILKIFFILLLTPLLAPLPIGPVAFSFIFLGSRRNRTGKCSVSGASSKKITAQKTTKGRRYLCDISTLRFPSAFRSLCHRPRNGTRRLLRREHPAFAIALYNYEMCNIK